MKLSIAGTSQAFRQQLRLLPRHQRLAMRSGFALLVVGIFGRIWAVGIYPPLGGLSVYIWVLGIGMLLTVVCGAASNFKTRRILDLLDEHVAVFPTIATASLLAIWATAVYVFTDTLATTRLLTFALGTGLIVAVWFAADSAFRVKLLLGIVVLGAVGSALYGIGVTVFGDPFMTVWVILSKVDLDRIPGIVAGGRMAGLSQNIIAFSYVLAAAVPLAFAFLVSGYRLRTRERTWTLWAALFFGLALMMTVLLLNATRSSILGAAGGCVVASAILLFTNLDLWKRMAVVLALVAALLLLMFVPGVRGAEAMLASGPMPSGEAVVSGLEDIWFGRALVRVSQPGWPSDADSPYEIELRDKIETARELWRESRADFGLNRRIVSLDDTSARARIPMALTALRYSLDYPLGTGRYSPEERHLPPGLEPRVAEEVLAQTPHNQFLVVLVYYGYPGLVLLAAFYLLIGRSLLATARHYLRSRDTESLLLVAAVAGSLAGYGLNSLFHNAGPFVGDWFHFVIVGLIFSIERLAAERALSSSAFGPRAHSREQSGRAPSPQEEMRSG